MAVTISTIAAKLTLDTSGFTAGAAKAEATAAKLDRSLRRGPAGRGPLAGPMSGMMGHHVAPGRKFGGRSRALPMAGFGGLGGAATVATIVSGALLALPPVFEAVSHSMERIDRNAKLADRLGISNESMQRLGLAAELAGTDVEVLNRAMLHMGKTIGSGGMPMDKRLLQVATAVSKIQDPAKRAATIEKIFGRQGREAINLLIQGGPGILKSAEAIDRFGLGISRIEAARVEAANDALTRLGAVSSGLFDKMTVHLAPAIEGFANAMVEFLRGAQLLNQYGPGLLHPFLGSAMNPQQHTIADLLGLTQIPAFFSRFSDAKAGGPRGIGSLSDPALEALARNRPHPSGAAVLGTAEAARMIQGSSSLQEKIMQASENHLREIRDLLKAGNILVPGTI